MYMFYYITISASFSFAVMWLIYTAPTFLSSNRHIINVRMMMMKMMTQWQPIITELEIHGYVDILKLFTK